jgi:autotransporter adhesin
VSNIAIGTNASVNTAGVSLATALGSGATVTASNSVALGANSIANQPNTVSVGAPGAERRITNVAVGIAPTDAVNVSQLQGLQSQVTGVQTEERRGIAAAIAANGYTTPMRAGGTTVGVSGGFFHGESAVGMSLAHRLASAPNLVVYGSYANSAGAENVYKVGGAYEF